MPFHSSRVWAVSLVAILLHPVAAQERADEAMVARIRAEAFDRGRVLDTFDQLANVIGPRLTNSPAHKRSVQWTVETLKSWGLSNVHTEPWEFGRGWTLERFSVEMLEPRYMPLSGYPKGWSGSTSGVITAAPVWLPNPSADEMKTKAHSLKGAIVMTSPVQEYFIRADRPPASGDLVTARPPNRPAMSQADLAVALKTAGVGVTLEPNIGEHGTIFVTAAMRGRTRFRQSCSCQSTTTSWRACSSAGFPSSSPSTCRAAMTSRIGTRTMSSPRFPAPIRP